MSTPVDSLTVNRILFGPHSQITQKDFLSSRESVSKDVSACLVTQTNPLDSLIETFARYYTAGDRCLWDVAIRQRTVRLSNVLRKTLHH